MAQPSSVEIMYLGSINVSGGTQVDVGTVLTDFTNADTLILKTKKSANEDKISLSVNGSSGFKIEYNEPIYYDGATTMKCIFSENCILAVGKRL